MSSQTFAVLDYNPGGHSGQTNIKLSRGLDPGMVLNVIAATTQRTTFDIKDAKGNILMHVNPRIDQNVVVFNSHKSSWGPEERPLQMPIKYGVKYCLHIACHPDGYRIFINGEELHFYKHRINKTAKLFEINGGQVFLASYKLNEPRWAIQHRSGIYNIYEFSCGGKTTLYETQLQGCNPLSWILIIGIVSYDAKRMDFNLISSCDQIIFHFNPRFTENCVVRNSHLKSSWGKEERDGGLPFQKSHRFALAIVAEDKYYRIYINGEEFTTYKHRHPVNTVTKLQIAKDVQLFKVIYQK